MSSRQESTIPSSCRRKLIVSDEGVHGGSDGVIGHVRNDQVVGWTTASMAPTTGDDIVLSRMSQESLHREQKAHPRVYSHMHPLPSATILDNSHRMIFDTFSPDLPRRTTISCAQDYVAYRTACDSQTW